MEVRHQISCLIAISARPARPHEKRRAADILLGAVLGGGLGVPYTGNPRHAGLSTRLRPLDDRAAPGKQR